MCNKITNTIFVALLFSWSATFLFSCDGAISETNIDASAIPVLQIDSAVLTHSENGDLSYIFSTARMYQYETKDSIYMTFSGGVNVKTFSDSTKQVVSTVDGRNAIYNDTKKTWVITGNVIGVNLEENITLYTEVLHWDQSSKTIYSNVESKVVDGEEAMIGLNGFTAKDDLSDIVFKKAIGRFYVDSTATVKDSVAISDTLNIKPNPQLKDEVMIVEEDKSPVKPQNIEANSGVL